MITNTSIFGLNQAMVASGYPMRTQFGDLEFSMNDLKRAERLGNSPVGAGHDQFLTGIIVQFDWTVPIKVWTEAQRYHFLDFVSSSSTMHKLKVFDLDKSYDENVDSRIIAIMKELQRAYNEEPTEKNFLRMIMSNPCGFQLTARMTTNYRQLKTIYRQRKYHRLPQWQEFCEWIKKLPFAKEMGLL